MMNGPFLEALRRRPLLLDTGMVGLLALLSLPAGRDFLTVDPANPKLIAALGSLGSWRERPVVVGGHGGRAVRAADPQALPGRRLPGGGRHGRGACDAVALPARAGGPGRSDRAVRGRRPCPPP